MPEIQSTILSSFMRKIPRRSSRRHISVRSHPEQINPSLSSTKPKHFWKNRENQRDFLNNLYHELGLKSWTDWYYVRSQTIKDHGGSSILQRFKNSPSKLLTSAFPEIEWDLTKFHQSPHSFWKNPYNQRQFMDGLAKKLDINEWEDWYKVTQSDIIKHGGSSLLAYYNHSPSKLITTIYSEYKWNLFDFSCAPIRFWSDKNNQRDYLQVLFKRLDLKNFDDWYSVTAKDIQKHGGNGILWLYKNSPSKMISSVFTEHNWKLHRFNQRKYKFSIEDAKNIFEDLALFQNISNPFEWRKVSITMMKHIQGGNALLNQTGSIGNALNFAYPDMDWRSIASISISKPQQLILKLLQKHFSDIQINFKHPDLFYSKSRKKMELDFYSESSRLAIEYQGQYHYFQLWEKCKDPNFTEIIDVEKMSECKRAGISLVVIPYWWRQTEQSLIEDIKRVRPDLISETFHSRGHMVENSSSFPLSDTAAQNLSLANTWSSTSDPSEWMISEKLNGYRAFREKESRALISRNGFLQSAPQLFLDRNYERISGLSLDGELWLGRSRFFHTQLALIGSDWSNVSFQTFDVT